MHNRLSQRHMKYATVFTSVVSGFLLSLPGLVSAQTAATPYWCGSYYSSVPCDGYGNTNYNNNYNNNYNYSYGYNYYPSTYYQQYPYYNSYPYTNYNYAYGYARPTCTISAINNSANYGAYPQVTLSWSSSNATSAYITPNVGTVSPYGSIVVYPNGGNYTYTMTVNGPGGSNTCQTSYYAPVQYYYQPYQPQYYYQSYPYLYSPYQYGYSW